MPVRCAVSATVNCPGQLSGKSLLAQGGHPQLEKEHLLEAGPWVACGEAGGLLGKARPIPRPKTMIGDVVHRGGDLGLHHLWRPARGYARFNIEHIRKIIDLRRNLVLTQSKDAGECPDHAQKYAAKEDTHGPEVQSAEVEG